MYNTITSFNVIMCDRRPNSAHFFALSCHSLFSHSTYIFISALFLYIKCHVALCVALCFHLPIAALYTQNQNLRHVSFPLFLFFPFWFCLCFCLLSSPLPLQQDVKRQTIVVAVGCSCVRNCCCFFFFHCSASTLVDWILSSSSSPSLSLTAWYFFTHRFRKIA